MKFRIIALTAAVLLQLGCDRNSPVAAPTSGPKQSSAISPTPAGDRGEAFTAAEKEWAKIWVQDGETWIAAEASRRYLLQIRGRRTEVSEDRLSEADRLNGVQWAGTVAFYRTAERRFGFRSSSGTLSMSQYDTGWNEWTTPESAIAVYKFKKQNGTWKLLENDLSEYSQLEFGRDEFVRPKPRDMQTAGVGPKDGSAEREAEQERKLAERRRQSMVRHKTLAKFTSTSWYNWGPDESRRRKDQPLSGEISDADVAFISSKGGYNWQRITIPFCTITRLEKVDDNWRPGIELHVSPPPGDFSTKITFNTASDRDRVYGDLSGSLENWRKEWPDVVPSLKSE